MKLAALEVAIAGAGIGGLSLAAMLARHGARVVVYDQMAAPQPVGSGFVLQPTGAAVLARMDLLEKVRARGARITRMHGRLADAGKTVLDVRYRPGQHGIAIQRVALFDLLLEAAVSAGVIFETASRTADVHDGERPSIILEGGRKTAPADIVVDAMGANSPLGHKAAAELGYGALWATVPWISGGPFHPELLEQRYHKASRMAGVLPVGTTRAGAPEMATFFWSIRNEDIDAWRSAGRAAWIEDVRTLWPEAGHFAEIAEPVHARYRHHTRSPLAGRRIVRVGDAWHATSPQLGQGANMALLDAASFCVALSGAETAEDALRTHLRQRQIHIRRYQALSLLLTPFYQSDSHILPLIRDLMTGPTSRLPIVRDVITSLVTGELLDPVKRISME